ncbi:MAG TPA: hydrogenase expression/formation protein HypE, partial [Coriobacteriia bacterium]|nr:hydrogenase expression/formation protein HypE [Coriobacteriia bacterium]
MDQVLLAYGSGGSMMHDLIDEMFIDAYGSDILRRGDDAAVLHTGLPVDRLAFTTDTFVVTPHFFPGGDIGRLAVCGTVNDLATSGAEPKWLSVAFVLEEGYPLENLRRICASIAETAEEAGVQVVTGDTKVVNRGHGDGIYINTSGIGLLRPDVELSGSLCRPGDRILISGTLGDHGIAIISAREQLALSTTVKSDAAPLNRLMSTVLKAAPHTHCFRD